MQDHAGSPSCPLEQPSGVVLISVWSNCTLGIGFVAKQTRRPGCAGSYSSCQSIVFRRVLLGVFLPTHAAQIRERASVSFAGPSGPLWPILAINPGRGKLLSNSRLPICGLIPLGSKVALIAVRGQWHSDRQKERQSDSQTARPSQTTPSHYRQLTRTPLSDIALVTSDRQVGCPGCILYCATPSHTLASHPRATHTHSHTGAGCSHTLTLPHRFRSPPANSTTAQAEKVWAAIPPHSHLPEGPPVPGFYLRSDPSLSWPAGKRTLAQP